MYLWRHTMAQKSTPPSTEGLNEAEIAIFDNADMFVVRSLAGGRFKKQMFRAFHDCHAAAAKVVAASCCYVGESCHDSTEIPIRPRAARRRGRQRVRDPRPMSEGRAQGWAPCRDDQRIHE